MKDNPTVTVIKSWIFPGLVSLVSMMIWNDVNEIKADVKALMAQSNIDKTRIDNLERNVYKTVTKHPNENPPLILARLEGILPTNKEIDED